MGKVIRKVTSPITSIIGKVLGLDKREEAPQPLPQPQALPEADLPLAQPLEQPKDSAAKQTEQRRIDSEAQFKKRRLSRRGRASSVVAGKLGNNQVSTVSKKLLGE